jgi:hypothetical protein
MVSGNNETDGVVYTKELVKVRKEVEFHIFQIVKDMEERTKNDDHKVYYYTDKSR